MERATKEVDKERIEEELNRPLPGASAEKAVVSQETIDRENDGFDALLGMTGGRG